MSNVQFILDEAALLGQMAAIDDALGIGRSYGVRLNLYYQSVGQLKHCFPDGGEQTVFSNTTQIFFGVNDNATADYVSTRLGEETIVVDSGGTGHSRSHQTSWGQQDSHSAGDNWSSNQNWSQQARKLLKPEEVMALPPRLAITFTPGVRPVMTQLLRHYEEKPKLWIEATKTSTGTRDVVRGVVMTVVCSLLAAGFTGPALRVLNGQPAFESTQITEKRPLPSYKE